MKFKNILSESAIISLIAIVIAITYNAFSPTGLPFIAKDRAELLVNDSLLFNLGDQIDTTNLAMKDTILSASKTNIVDSSLVLSPELKPMQTNADSLQASKKILVSPDFPKHSNSDEFKLVSFEQMKKIVNSPSFVVIDARRPEDFAKEHIPNSINIFPYLEESEYITKLLNLPKDKTIIIYCDGGTCDLSHEVANALVSNFGFTKVFIYEGGWEEWTRKIKNS